MTKNDFIALCDELLIDPAIAMENERVLEALIGRDDARVEEVLREEF